MKYLIQLLFLLCFFTLQSDAQAYRNTKSATYEASSKSSKQKKKRVYKDNLGKLNLSGLLFKSVGLQGEHKITRKTSVALGFIYRPMGSWILSKFYDSTTASVSVSQETKYMFASSKYRSLMLTPEFRYYLGRHAPAGLYLAAFARFKFDKTRFNYHYYDDVNFNQEIGVANLHETAIGGGILFGYQLITRKNWSIDFWFLGPWLANNHVNLSSKVNTANISSLQQTFIGQDIKPWFSNNKEVVWNSEGIATRYNALGLGLRFLGINIGYNF